MTDNPEKFKILVVDDDKSVLSMLGELFETQYSVILVSSGKAAIETARKNPDLMAIVMDIKMPEIDGITASREIKKFLSEVPIIFHTAYPGDYDEDLIDEKEKPFDYVLKGDNISRLLRSVKNAVESYQLKRDNARLISYAESSYGLIGKSALMQEVFKLIRKVAASDISVIIVGETGTGKELVAKAIHDHSLRKDHRIGILNCNHKSPYLVEAELFGHIKGAYTGAIQDGVGLFEYANQGTVFLDEISDLDISTQGKLLRVLESGEYNRVGEAELKKTDIRILCATRNNLMKLSEDGKFRDDLFYRLDGVTINLPPLRERVEDIPVLVGKFIDQMVVENGWNRKVFDNSAINSMIDFDWPGNVRQLKKVVETLMVMSDSDIILADDVSRHLRNGQSANIGMISLRKAREDAEKSVIVKMLHETNNNLSGTARILKVDRKTLYRLIKKYNLTL